MVVNVCDWAFQGVYRWRVLLRRRLFRRVFCIRVPMDPAAPVTISVTASQLLAIVFRFALRY